jgi:hypothetical protein
MQAISVARQVTADVFDVVGLEHRDGPGRPRRE